MKGVVMRGLILAAIIVGSSLSVFIVTAWAESGYIVDMTTVLMGEDGRPARDVFAKDPVAKGQEDPDPRCEKCPALRLGVAVSHALFASFPEDHDTPDQKWARAVLAQRVSEEKAAQLTAEEVAVIKRQLGKAYGGIVLMQAFPLLDPNSKPPEVK
jgi:hypothetical protein